jgi:hypothetical protein
MISLECKKDQQGLFPAERCLRRQTQANQKLEIGNFAIIQNMTYTS